MRIKTELKKNHRGSILTLTKCYKVCFIKKEEKKRHPCIVTCQAQYVFYWLDRIIQAFCSHAFNQPVKELPLDYMLRVVLWWNHVAHLTCRKLSHDLTLTSFVLNVPHTDNCRQFYFFFFFFLKACFVHYECSCQVKRVDLNFTSTEQINKVCSSIVTYR